ncbi:TetR/AcrR family transcriptional regulator [Polaromonas sp. P1(28)-13]|nr:TetR/AcrR family transcriptional regulator [Polaromonas sp. P1(28)-13]
MRERILATAATLFYQEGVRAVGVDLVVERSGVAKTSLYRHFATKDDLVVAFLEREDAEYWGDWEKSRRQRRMMPVRNFRRISAGSPTTSLGRSTAAARFSMWRPSFRPQPTPPAQLPQDTRSNCTAVSAC